MDLLPEDIDLLQHSMGGGFTKAQLAKWGVPWPPERGWRQKLLAEHGLIFHGPHKKLKGFKVVEIPEQYQPLLDAVGGEYWNQLSAYKKAAIMEFLAKASKPLG